MPTSRREADATQTAPSDDAPAERIPPGTEEPTYPLPPAANSRRIAVKAADKAAFTMLCAGWEPVIVEAQRSRYEQGSANDDGHP